MKRWLVPVLLALLVASVAKARAGWPAALFAGASTGILSLYVGALARGRAMRKAPEAPAMLAGETALLHGPVEVLAADGTRPCWAYLSEQRLSLLPSDGSDGAVLWLKDLKELRPAKPGRLGGHGPLGLVFEGQLWQLQVPDAERWTAALKNAIHKTP